MNTYTPEMVTAAVARGAAWLDQQCPDWASEINLSKLKLESPSACVLGQTAKCLTGRTYGSYTDVLGHFDVVHGEWAAEHGFDVVSTHDDGGECGDFDACCSEMDARYEMLTIAWTILIRERLGVPA